MATMQGKETFGRARLSFAQEADVDEFVSMLARFEAGEIGPDEWRAFRLLRGTYGQRQTSDAQMMRVKIPQGVVDAQQLEVAGRASASATRAASAHMTRQNVQFHFVKLHDAELAMRQARRRRDHDARGLRQLGPQHHRLPVRRRCPGRTVRRHAVRRVADALPAAPSAELVAAAQVQDRVRRLRRRSRRRRHQRHRLACPRQGRRRRIGARLPRHRRRRHRDHGGGPVLELTSSCRPTRCSIAPKRSSASSIASATTSTSRETG